MPDFSLLLKRPGVEAKRPPALPADDYLGIVKSFELGDSNTNKTPYVRYFLGLTDWGPSVPDSWDTFDPATNKSYSINRSNIDLSKRQMRRDYYVTPEATWRLHEFLVSCGIEPEPGSDGLIDYNEYIPQAIGKSVTVEVQQYMNNRTNEIGNQVGGLRGEG